MCHVRVVCVYVGLFVNVCVCCVWLHRLEHGAVADGGREGLELVLAHAQHTEPHKATDFLGQLSFSLCVVCVCVCVGLLVDVYVCVCVCVCVRVCVVRGYTDSSMAQSPMEGGSTSSSLLGVVCVRAYVCADVCAHLGRRVWMYG